MEYVIKNKRLRNFLYTLGFNYNTVPDRTCKQDEVYLFKNTDALQEALIFYSDFRHKQVKDLEYPKMVPQEGMNKK